MENKICQPLLMSLNFIFHISKSSDFHSKIWCVLNTHWYEIKKTLCNFKKFQITTILQQIKLRVNYNFFKKNYTDRPLVFKCYFIFRLLERSTYLGCNYCQFLLVLGFCVSRLMQSHHLDDVWGELKSYIKVNL